MSKAICCLSIYATICTIIIIILSYIISAQISCSLVSEVSGMDNKVKMSNNYEFLSFDNRKSEDGSEKCSTWDFHGFQLFEFLVMGIFAIFILVKGAKKCCGKGGILEKRKEMKLKRDAAKFEKLKSKFVHIVETDKTDAKGHATDSSKELVKESHAVAIKLPPFIL